MLLVNDAYSQTDEYISNFVFFPQLSIDAPSDQFTGII